MREIEASTGWANNARRFASGTPAVLPSLLSRPGLAIVREIGIETIRALSLERTDRIISRADQIGLHVATPRSHDRRGGIVALRFPGDAEVERREHHQGKQDRGQGEKHPPGGAEARLRACG